MKRENKTLNDYANKPGNKYLLMVIDETTMWREDIRVKAGKIEGIYLVNLKEPTHLCELSVSFPAEHIGNFLHNIEGFTEDELFNYEKGDLRGDIQYYSGGYIPNKKKIYNSGSFEDAMEYESANPTYC